MEKKFAFNILIIRAFAFFLFLNYLISPIFIQLGFKILMGKEWMAFISTPEVIFRLVTSILIVVSLLFIFYLKRMGGFLLIGYLVLEFIYNVFYVVTHQINLSSFKMASLFIGGFLMSNVFLLILLFNVFQKQMQTVLDSEIEKTEFASVIKDSFLLNELVKWTILFFLIVYFVSRILMYWGNAIV